MVSPDAALNFDRPFWLFKSQTDDPTLRIT